VNDPERKSRKGDSSVCSGNAFQLGHVLNLQLLLLQLLLLKPETVVDCKQFIFEMVLLQTHPPLQVRVVLASALQAVNRVPLFVGLDEERVEDLFLAVVAEVGRVVLSPAVVSHGNASRSNETQSLNCLANASGQGPLDGFIEPDV
jgi:hypothetical protein